MCTFVLAIMFGLTIARSDDKQPFEELYEVNPQVREQRCFNISQSMNEVNAAMSDWNAELSRARRFEDIRPKILLGHIKRARKALGSVEHELERFDRMEAHDGHRDRRATAKNLRR